jgi:hypothetical protein
MDKLEALVLLLRMDNQVQRHTTHLEEMAALLYWEVVALELQEQVQVKLFLVAQELLGLEEAVLTKELLGQQLRLVALAEQG